MSWPNGTFSPTEASLFFNTNGTNLQQGQVSNVDTASMVSPDLAFPPPPTEAPVLSNMNGSHLHHGQETPPIIEQTTLNQENEMVNPNVEISSRSKRRKPWSKVWDDFTKHVGEDGKEWAKCNHCQNKFVGSSKSGTTHLKNHLERCPRKINPGVGADKAKEKCMIDQELNGFDMVRKIIKYGLNSIKSNILDVYQEEKEKLRRYFNKLPCRFSLSFDEYKGYWFMILYFIDDSWELKKRIIHLQIEEYEEEFVQSLIVDLSIDKNIISMVDNTNKLTEMNTWFRERGSIACFVKCASLYGLLNNLYYDIEYLESTSRNHMFDMFEKARKLQAYVSSNENKFQIAVDKAKSMGKKVTSQGGTGRWLWGVELLEWVIEVKEAFSELEHMDPDFKSINFIKEDWDYATSLYECWKLVRDAIRRLSDCKFETANVYFPIMCDIILKLVQWEKKFHQYNPEIALIVREYFDEYWSNYNLILVISVILDPRFKMEIVELWYKEIYGDDANVHLNKISIDVTNIYNEYANGTNNSKSLFSWDHGYTNSSVPLKMLDAMGRPCTSPQHVNILQSELDRYLKGSKCDRVEEFDILAWWRVNSLIYPTLARMARNFLTIPFNGFDNKLIYSSLFHQVDDTFQDEKLDDDIKQPLACTKVLLYALE